MLISAIKCRSARYQQNKAFLMAYLVTFILLYSFITADYLLASVVILLSGVRLSSSAKSKTKRIKLLFQSQKKKLSLIKATFEIVVVLNARYVNCVN